MGANGPPMALSPTDSTGVQVRLRLYLLGAPRVEHAGQPLAVPRRQTRALLYYLAAQPAKGMLFITLEDEEGLLNLIVRPAVDASYRKARRNAPLLWVEGRLQRQGQVTSVLVHRAAAL